MRLIIFILLFISISINCYGQATSIEIDNQNPGWLSSKINYGDQITVRNIKVTGYLNGTDIRFIRELNINNSLRGTIDLSESTIVAGGDPYFFSDPIQQIGAQYTKNNTVGAYMFYHMHSLSKLILPNNTTELDGNAFGSLRGSNIFSRVDSIVVNCPNLKSAPFSSLHWRNDIKYICLGEGIEDLHLGYLLMPTGNSEYEQGNNYVATDTIELHFPNTLKDIKYTYKEEWETLKIFSNIQHPEQVKGQSKLFVNGTIYVPEGTIKLYQQSIFKNLNIVEDIYPNELKLNIEKTRYYVGDIITIYSEISPSTSIHNKLRWTSSTDACRINEDGTIEAVAFGNTNITAITENDISATCQLEIYEHVSNIEIPKSTTIYIGDKMTLEPQLYPIGKTYSKVLYETSNSNIATIDENGIITGVSQGCCVITAISEDGNHKAECTITVQQPVESIIVSPKSITLKAGEITILTAIILPSNADDQSYIWETEDDNIATITPDGKVTAIAGGHTKLYAISHFNNEIKDYCDITVSQPVTGIYFEETEIELSEGGSLKLEATVIPTNASNKKIKWSSSDNSIVIVSDEGLIFGLKPGQATIIATTEDGGFIALCKITVITEFVYISDIILDKEEIEGIEQTEQQLYATILPENASNKILLWRSSDNSVASVDNQGFIRLLKEGDATISATATDNSGKSATCHIIVKKESGLSEISFEHNETIKIYNLTGYLIFNGKPSDVNIPAGFYIVEAGNQTFKTYFK